MEKTKIARRQQVLLDHLVELRNRLLVVALSVGLFGGGAFLIHDKIEAVLTRPLGQNLYYSSPGGGFDFVFKLCISSGIILSLPIILRQLLRFAEPVISSHVRSHITRFMGLSLLLALGGVSFAYFVTLPATLNFLNNFTTEGIEPLIATNEYISFVMTYLLAFALIFQLPLIIWIINNIKPLRPSSLLKYSRFVFVGAFIFAAILTPTPDLMNQVFMAVPIIALYIVSIIVLLASNWRRSLTARKADNSLALPKSARHPSQPPLPVFQIVPQASQQPNVVLSPSPTVIMPTVPVKISTQPAFINDIAPPRPSVSRAVMPAKPAPASISAKGQIRRVYRSMDIVKPSGLTGEFGLTTSINELSSL